MDQVAARRTALRRLLLAIGVEETTALQSAWAATERAPFERWRLGLISMPEYRRERLRGFLPDTCRGLEDAQLDALFAHYYRGYVDGWRAFPDAAATLRALRRRGIAVAVLSNGTEQQQSAKLLRTGLHPLVDALWTSERIGAAKPDRAAFSGLCRRLGLAEAEVGFVGDDPVHDVAGARAAGLRAALVVRPGPAVRVGLAVAVDAVLRAPRARRAS